MGIVDGGCGGDYPPGYPLDTSRLGTFAFTALAADKVLNVTQETIHYSVVDTMPPTITLASPADGATYIVGQLASASFSCDDGNGSGMHGCKGDLPGGSQLDTTTVGAHTFTVTAYDRAGNVARTTHSYSVVYDFAGFGSPAAAYQQQHWSRRAKPSPEVLTPRRQGHRHLRRRLARLDTVRRPGRPHDRRREPLLQSLR